MLNIECECDHCQEDIDIDDAVITCEDCKDKISKGLKPQEEYYYGGSEVMALLKENAKRSNFYWEESGFMEFGEFESQAQKELFLKGIKIGFSQAYYSICGAFNLEDTGFIEDEIDPIFNPPKETK